MSENGHGDGREDARGEDVRGNDGREDVRGDGHGPGDASGDGHGPGDDDASWLARTTHAHLAGEFIERHRHDDHQLVYVSSGVLAVRTGEASFVASRDRAVWIPAGTWHQHRVHGNSRVHTLAFGLREPVLSRCSPLVVGVDALLRELIIAFSDPALPLPEARRLRWVLRDRLRRAEIQPLTLPTARSAELRRACRLVTDDLAQPRTADWLARRVGVSRRTLARLFRSEFHMTYPQWRTATRVYHAMILLAEGTSVSATAQRCGWATTSAFVDSFSRTMGQTPGRYRAGPG